MKNILTVLLILIFSTNAFSQTSVSEEELKTAFIFHFINYTEWEDATPNLNVCIPDDTELRDNALTMINGKMINNKKIVVQKWVNNCQVLVSDTLPSTPTTLTIGSLVSGALLEFRKIDNKLKFAVNLNKVKGSRFKISSQLLKLAILQDDI